MIEPTHLHRIPLPDGRLLAIAEYGDPAGTPLLFLHGTPGSHLLAGLIAEKARQYGFRLLAPDRPGSGHSTHDPARTFLSFAEDMHVGLDHLSIARAHLVGISGGGPYTLACAHAMPERIAHIVLLSPWWFPHGQQGATLGLDRLFRTYAWAVRHAPWLTRVMTRTVAALARKDPRLLLKNVLRHAPPDDKRLLAAPETQAQLTADIAMAFRQGWQGQWRETFLHFSAPGFDVAQIQIPIAIHQGAMDNIVPLHFAERLAVILPNATLNVEPEGGHFVALRLQDVVFAALSHEA